MKKQTDWVQVFRLVIIWVFVTGALTLLALKGCGYV